MKFKSEQITRHFSSNPLPNGDGLENPDNGRDNPSPAPAAENNSKNMDYSNTPIARPTLIFGEDTASMTEGRVLQKIKGLQAENKDLAETGVTSTRLSQRIAANNEVIAELVKKLDTFAAPATPAATE